MNVVCIREYKGFLVDSKLNIYSKRTGRKLNPYMGTDGYMQVQYRNSSGNLVHERVHVIYGHTYIPNPNRYKYINHIDSDKTNNNLNNLEWCTNSHNVKHGWESGKRTHKNRTKVFAIDEFGVVYRYNSIREMCNDLKLDRHKVARILKNEIPNRYKYNFDYVMSNDYRKNIYC